MSGQRSERAVVMRGEAPVDLLAAFWAYDRALRTNDIAALDALFTDAVDTIRVDGEFVLIGHDEIARFRATRPAPPTRRVTVVHVRMIGASAALIMAEVTSPAGAPGMQTQLWCRRGGSWTVDAAHVTAPR